MLLKQLREVADGFENNEFVNALSTFTCKDKEVKTFLKDKAFEFDRRNRSRTYLVLDEGKISNNKLQILAYFTLSLKVLVFDDHVSKNAIKKIDGFSKDVSSVATILIGQFGKDQNIAQDISGDIFLNMCLGITNQARHLIGGRIALLECLPIEPVVAFYERNGFHFLQSDKKDKYQQMIKPL